jgi:hypothetical protein
VAEAVLKVVALEDPPLHLLLGHDVYKAFREKLEGLLESVEAWKETTLDVNFPPE